MKDGYKAKRSQRRKKQFAVDAFGGSCQMCGYNKCIGALEFHHISKDNKKETPSDVILSKTWSEAKEELDKCIMLCANCHREVHYSKLDLSLRIKIIPWITIECKRCKSEFDTKNYSQQYCGHMCASIDSRKAERPSKSELEDMLLSGATWVELGKIYGVSDNAVRKWAKRLKLPVHHKYWKEKRDKI